MVTILRRPKLGRTSCREIVTQMENRAMVVRNDRIESRRERFRYNPETTMVVRWGCTASVPCRNVLNRAEAIHLVNNKVEFRRVLMEHGNGPYGVPLCPQTYFHIQQAQYPVIARPARHAQGRQLYVCNNEQELRRATQLINGSWYASDLINKVSEYRVFVGSGRVVWVAQKTPGNPDEIAWNVARGGRFDNVRWGEWPLRVVNVAIEAFKLSGLDFGGVDVMVDENNVPYVLEINSAPSQTSPYRQSCVAKYIDYVVEHGKDMIPVSEERGDWKKWGHPSLDERVWR